MTDDNDDDIRVALARAHEPAPPFDAISAPRVARRSRVPYLIAATAVAAAAVVLVVAWPRTTTPPPVSDAAVALDLTAPALSRTSLVMPLDSLLDVPELATLGTLPQLGTGGLP